MSGEGKVQQICMVRPESMLSRSHNKAIYIRRSCVDTANYEGKVDICRARTSQARGSTMCGGVSGVVIGMYLCTCICILSD